MNRLILAALAICAGGVPVASAVVVVARPTVVARPAPAVSRPAVTPRPAVQPRPEAKPASPAVRRSTPVFVPVIVPRSTQECTEERRKRKDCKD